MEAGPFSNVSRATSLTLTVPRAEGMSSSPMRLGSLRNCSSSRSLTENCSSPSLYLETSLPPTSRPEAGCQGVDRHPQIGGARPVDIHAQLLLGRFEVGVNIHQAGDRSQSLHQVGDVDLELLDVRTLNQHVDPVGCRLRPPPRPPALDAPEMSVPPETLIRAALYLRNIVRARRIISCCETLVRP